MEMEIEKKMKMSTRKSLSSHREKITKSDFALNPPKIFFFYPADLLKANLNKNKTCT